MECFPGVMVKRRGEYRGPLKGEKNELVAEFAIPETLAPGKKYIVAVEAKVHTSNEVGCAPLQVSQVKNRDVLFSFEAAIVLGK